MTNENKKLKQSQKEFNKYLKSELKFQKSLGKFLTKLIKKGKIKKL